MSSVASTQSLGESLLNPYAPDSDAGEAAAQTVDHLSAYAQLKSSSNRFLAYIFLAFAVIIYDALFQSFRGFCCPWMWPFWVLVPVPFVLLLAEFTGSQSAYKYELYLMTFILLGYCLAGVTYGCCWILYFVSCAVRLHFGIPTGGLKQQEDKRFAKDFIGLYGLWWCFEIFFPLVFLACCLREILKMKNVMNGAPNSRDMPETRVLRRFSGGELFWGVFIICGAAYYTWAMYLVEQTF